MLLIADRKFFETYKSIIKNIIRQKYQTMKYLSRTSRFGKKKRKEKKASDQKNERYLTPPLRAAI